MMQHQSPEYDSVPAESITLVSRFKWRVVQAAFILTIVGGCVVFVILDDIGLSSLKRQFGLVRSFQSADELVYYGETADTEFRAVTQAGFVAPFIIEMSSVNRGTEDSAWGIWVQTVDHQDWRFLVNNGGYFSVADNDEPDWIEFIHIRAYEENTIYLHFPADYEDSPYPWNDERTLEIPSSVTLRINNEIAWTGELPPRVARWGVLRYRNPRLEWSGIYLFTRWADSDSIYITPNE